MPINLFQLKPDELKEKLSTCPAYRYKQLSEWVYKKLIFDLSKMSNLPKELKDFIEAELSMSLPCIAFESKAKDGTTKYGLELEDSSFIEMVLMPEAKKSTLCVSSQVGCARDCLFCATGKMGLKRNLETYEIVGQIVLAAKMLFPKPLTNLVLMGMGEPMDNLDNVLSTLQIIQAEDFLSFSPRRTTISTCGVPKGIISLADSGVKAKLAVSLNSAIEEKRSQLMPVNLKHPLKQLKEALYYYQKKSSFRITFEYILIPGFNMSTKDISALKKFVGDLSCKLNFIPYNLVDGLPYRPPTEAEIEAFMIEAQSLNQAITLRRSKGAEIFGACGQLALKQKGVL